MTGGECRAGDQPKLIVAVQDFDEAREVCAEIERWAKHRRKTGTEGG